MLALVPGPVGAIHQKNVLPAVAVVVEKCATGAECLRQQFPAVSAAVVTKTNSSRSSYIDQSESGIRSSWINGRRWRSREGVQQQARCGRQARHAPEKRSTIHGKSTSPLRMA